MTKNAESLEAVYIYIYIVRFNEITLCERSEAMYFKQRKICLKYVAFLYFVSIVSIGTLLVDSVNVNRDDPC